LLILEQPAVNLTRDLSFTRFQISRERLTKGRRYRRQLARMALSGSDATDVRSAAIVWLRRWPYISQAGPFSSMYVSSRLVASSR
jgi:hypothetical protein